MCRWRCRYAFYMMKLFVDRSGFIGSHLGKRLKSDGYYVVAADWKENEYMKPEEFCDEFLLLDLRDLKNCIQATKDCKMVFNLAADMGGYIFCEVDNDH